MNQKNLIASSNQSYNNLLSLKNPKDNIIYKVLQDMHKFMNQLFVHVPSKIIDNKYGCFGSLDIEGDHIAAGEENTFYINETTLLRPHASNFQNIVIENYFNTINEKCEQNYIGFYNIGKVFRRDDSRMHNYFFHQCDIMIFGPTANLSNLRDLFQKLIFQIGVDNKIRIRHSYFPFTSPSYEIDMLYNKQYIEIAGMGITSTKHMKSKIKNNIKAIAAGIGIDRIACTINEINSIKSARLT